MGTAMDPEGGVAWRECLALPYHEKWARVLGRIPWAYSLRDSYFWEVFGRVVAIPPSLVLGDGITVS